MGPGDQMAQGWGGTPSSQDTPLPPSLASYSKEQVKLLCLAQVGDGAGLCAKLEFRDVFSHLSFIFLNERGVLVSSVC